MARELVFTIIITSCHMVTPDLTITEQISRILRKIEKKIRKISLTVTLATI